MKLTIHAKGAVEDSAEMRIVAALAVEVALLAVVVQGAVDGFTAACVLLAAPAGYLFSYRQRHHSNLTTKILLSIGLLVAFAQFLGSVRTVTMVDQARIPLASLFLWVQVLHSFDVPRRRDLAFSMMSSVVLMAEAGALSLTSTLLWFMVVWAVLAAVWLFLSSAPPAGLITPVLSIARIRAGRGRAAPVRFVGLSASVVLLSTIAVFLAMPRLPGSFTHVPPFSLTGARPVGSFDGEVSNPGLPASTNGVVDFASNAYPGFSDVVDLRARGQLSDDIAFRVRSSQSSLWRAEVFNTFDGATWTIGDTTTTSLPTGTDGGVTLPQPAGGIFSVRTAPLTQTFYIASPQPNVLFAAYRPDQIYFPSGGLRVDGYDSVRAPIFLDTGMIYSVVSNIPILDPQTLRAVGPLQVPRTDADLQLPQAMPSRVAHLAARITRSRSTEYDKVIAVQDWIAANTQYDLNVARDPLGVDTVDRFLFVTKRGFCEQIASAMAVMLRTQGIPTRLVTGYGPGTWNPLTGYYEVKQSDAHAWLEVYYPAVGWVPYDPTFGVPEASGSGAHFVAPQALAAIAHLVGRAIPAPLKRAAGATAREMGRLAGWGRRHVGIAAVALLACPIVIWRRRRRRRRDDEPADAGAGIAFSDLTAALTPFGHPRRAYRTPSEYLRELRGDAALASGVIEAAELVVRTLERERFARSKPTDADVMRARAAAALVRDLVRP